MPRRGSHVGLSGPSNQASGAGQADALAAAAAAPNTVDAVVVFEDGGAAAPGARYTIRANHTGLPSTRVAYNAFDILPDSQYRDFWFFANLQLALDRCAGPAASSTASGTGSWYSASCCPSPGLARYSIVFFFPMWGQQLRALLLSQHRAMCCMQRRRVER